MRIKRLELTGFKSFCDRSIVDFSDPIVGIVGPNGCGKSNIVDAIRWCMGEQSAKHLRGQAMADVIFAGSDSRGPSGLAEVSLTFEDVGFSHETLELLTTPTEIDQLPEDDGEETSLLELENVEEENAEENGDFKDPEERASVKEDDNLQSFKTNDPASETRADDEVREKSSIETDADQGEQEDPLAATKEVAKVLDCLLYTSPSPRDATLSRMPSSA